MLPIPSVGDPILGMDDRAEPILAEGPLGNGHVWSAAARQRVTALPTTPPATWDNLAVHPTDPSTFVGADGIGPLSRWRRPSEVRTVASVRLTLDGAPEGEILHASARLVDAERVEVFQVPRGENPR